MKYKIRKQKRKRERRENNNNKRFETSRNNLTHLLYTRNPVHLHLYCPQISLSVTKIQGHNVAQARIHTHLTRKFYDNCDRTKSLWNGQQFVLALTKQFVQKNIYTHYAYALIHERQYSLHVKVIVLQSIFHMITFCCNFSTMLKVNWAGNIFWNIKFYSQL